MVIVNNTQSEKFTNNKNIYSFHIWHALWGWDNWMMMLLVIDKGINGKEDKNNIHGRSGIESKWGQANLINIEGLFVADSFAPVPFANCIIKNILICIKFIKKQINCTHFVVCFDVKLKR